MKEKKKQECTHCWHATTRPMMIVLRDGYVHETCCKCQAGRSVHADHATKEYPGQKFFHENNPNIKRAELAANPPAPTQPAARLAPLWSGDAPGSTCDSQPAAPTPGEDAWIDEIESAVTQGALTPLGRDKVRTILRAYRANLLSQPALLESVADKARGEALEQVAQRLEKDATNSPYINVDLILIAKAIRALQP